MAGITSYGVLKKKLVGVLQLNVSRKLISMKQVMLKVNSTHSTVYSSTDFNNKNFWIALFIKTIVRT